MTTRSFWLKAFGVALGASLWIPSSVVDAKPPAAKNKQEAPAAVPAAVPQAPRLTPKGLKWGMNVKKVGEIYAAAITDDYNKRYADTEPGVAMTALDFEIKQRKDEFALSHVSFDAPPSSLDGTEFVGEFTYGNKESFQQITRKGKHTYLFYMRSKIWKIIDVVELAKSKKWGPDFNASVAKIEKMLEVKGRVRAADPDAGRAYAEVDWADATTHLRVANWDKKVAFIYVELDTEKRLDSLRTAKIADPQNISPATQKVLRK